MSKEAKVHLSDFAISKSLFDVLHSVAYERSRGFDFIGFLEEALKDWSEGRGLSRTERQRASEALADAFKQHRLDLIDVLAIPGTKQTSTYPALVSSAKAWFWLNRRCPECGGPVDQTRKDKLLCSRRCNKRFYVRVWRKRQTKEKKNRLSVSKMP